MRPTPLVLLLTAILIAGCARQSVDCSIGAGHNGCVPGTKEYEQMAQQQQDAKINEAMDDALCLNGSARKERSRHLKRP
jgi:hypothetical protein